MRVTYIGPDREFPGFGRVGHGSVIEATEAQIAEFGGQVFEDAGQEPVDILPYGSIRFDGQAFQRKLEGQREDKVEEKRLGKE